MRALGPRATLFCMVIALASAGCASQDDEWGMPPADYRWAGEGPPGNFTNDSVACRRSPGFGMTNYGQVQDSTFRRPVDELKTSIAQTRIYNDCLRSRGWVPVTAGAPDTTPDAEKPPEVPSR